MSFLLSAFGLGKALLSFFSKPPGIYIAAAIAACLGLWWFGHLKYVAGVAAAAAAATARNAAIKAKQDRDVAIANSAAASRAVVSEKQGAQAQEVVSNVKKDAAAMPNSGDIAVTADVADRLRSIR